MSYYLQRIGWFVCLVLLQVLVLNYVHIGLFATPLLYVWFILKFNSDTGRKELMIWAFFMGLCIDIFSNTPGLNASAATLLAFVRQPLLRMQTARDMMTDFEPGIRSMGFSPFLRYISIGLLVHACALNVIDYFSFFNIGTLLLKIVSDVLITLVCILCVDTIRRKK